VETWPSTTSMETRCVMGAVTQAAAMKAAAIARNSVKLKEWGAA
jgi:hypothetical protein